jgi:hypothetical protein
MIFDKQLCFIENGSLSSITNGVVGAAIDLGASRALDGRASHIAIECGQTATATGTPVITFTLEFSDDNLFASGKTVLTPLALPPLGKADLVAGKTLLAPSPLGARRWVRLKVTSTTALTCAQITAGITLDPQTNV